MRYVHHNKCAGGHAFWEVDNKIYCLGRVDAAFEVKVLQMNARSVRDCSTTTKIK